MKVEKSFNDIIEKIETGLSSNKEFLKSATNLFTDVIGSVESFGKSLSKISRPLIGHTSNDISLFIQNNEFFGRELSLTIEEFTKFCSPKLADITEKVNAIQKQMTRTCGSLQQELNTLRNQYTKELTKRERLIKEANNSLSVFQKSQESHDTKYNLSLLNKEQSNVVYLLKELESNEKAANMCGDKINELEEKLVDAVSDIHQVWQLSEKMIIENHFAISLKLLSSLKVALTESMKIFKDSIVVLRETNQKERDAVFLTLDNSQEQGLALLEERRTAQKAFKNFLKDYSSAFESFSKVILKASKGAFSEKHVEINFYAPEVEHLTKYITNFPLFVGIKIDSLEAIQRESKLNVVKSKGKKIEPDVISNLKTKEISFDNSFVNLLEGLFSQILIILDVGLGILVRSIDKINEENDTNMSIELIPLSFKATERINLLPSFRESISNLKDFEISVPDLNIEENEHESANVINDMINKESSLEKITISKSLEKKFKLSTKDMLLYSYSCAFAQKILLQGRLYVFSTKVCFHSFFNNQTLFGETVLVLPLEDVERVEARVNFIFDNMISFVTKQGELNFASFLYRDQALVKIKDLLEKRKKVLSPGGDSDENFDSPSRNSSIEQKLSQEIASPSKDDSSSVCDGKNENQSFDQIEIEEEKIEKKEEEEEEVDLEGSQKDEILNQFQEVDPKSTFTSNSNQIEKIEPFSDPFKYTKENSHTFEGYSLGEVINTIYSNKKLNYEGKEYPNYINLLLDKNLSTLDQNDDWSPQVKDFKGINSGVFTMTLKFTRKIKDKPLFAPSSCVVVEKFSLRFCGKNEAYVEIWDYFEKIPYCDCFFIKYAFKYIFNPEKGSTTLQMKYGVEFVKSTIFRGKIESDSLAQIQTVWEKLHLIFFSEFLKPKDYLPIEISQTSKIQKKPLKNSTQVKQKPIPSTFPTIDNTSIEKLLKEQFTLQQKYLSTMETNIENLKNIFVLIFIVLSANLLINIAQFRRE